MIGGAGVTVELVLACLATFAWPFLAEGPLKSLAFSIATVGWVLSLAINLNPLMRFDGYYLFADALGIDNLQSRAFSLGRWRMRELLFGLGAKPPEQFDKKTTRILVWFAWAVWIYRLILFTGIALLVYYMSFKILGLVLFAVEIIYFIAKPVAQRTGALVARKRIIFCRAACENHWRHCCLRGSRLHYPLVGKGLRSSRPRSGNIGADLSSARGAREGSPRQTRRKGPLWRHHRRFGVP